MSTKGKSVVSITAIIKAAAAAKPAPEKAKTFIDGNTYVQYVVSSTEDNTFRFEPTRRWVKVTEADDKVICFKNLASVVKAIAQGAQGVTDKGIAPESLDTQATGKGFGVHDRIFEVKPTEEITDLLAAVVSYDGEEHVIAFKAMNEADKATRKTYRKVEGEAKAELIRLRNLG